METDAGTDFCYYTRDYERLSVNLSIINRYYP